VVWLLRTPGTDTADVFLEPTFEEEAFDLHIELEYASGHKTASTDRDDKKALGFHQEKQAAGRKKEDLHSTPTRI
jgi:hypothetical protein